MLTHGKLTGFFCRPTRQTSGRNQRFCSGTSHWGQWNLSPKKEPTRPARSKQHFYPAEFNGIISLQSGELAAKSGLKKRSISVRFQKSTIRKVVVPQVELREDCDQLAKEAKAMLGPRESIDFPSPPPQPVQFDTISEEEEDESDYQLPQVNSSSVHHHQ